MTRPARAALQVLLDADGEELYVKQIAARAELALGTGGLLERAQTWIPMKAGMGAWLPLARIAGLTADLSQETYRPQ